MLNGDGSRMNAINNLEKVFTSTVCIHNIGTWVPEFRVSSESELKLLSERMSIDLSQLAAKSGVKERRKSSRDLTLVDMAINAINDLFSRPNTKNIPIADIDTVIYASVSRMHAEPATAILIQKRLGIESAMSFDVSDACLSFIDGMLIADSLITAGRARVVLVVSAEKGAQVADYSMEAVLNGQAGIECLAAITLGDGAAAALITSHDYSPDSKLRIHAFTRASRSQYADCCILPSIHQPMTTDSFTMFEGGLLHYPPMFRRLISELGWDINDIVAIVPHQASLKMIRAGAHLIGFPPDDCVITLDDYGNMASVSVPFSLGKLLDSGRLAKNSRIAITGFGSGLSFSMIALEVLDGDSL